MLSLRTCKVIDCTNLVPAQTSALTRRLFASSVSFHPSKPLIAIGAQEYVAVFDLLSGSRLGRIDVRSLVVELAFSPEGSQLVVALEDWQICSISLSSWKSRILVPRRSKAEAALTGCLLAISSGPRPVVYFSKHGKEIVRLAYVTRTEIRDAKGRIVKDAKETSWGLKLKLDVTKPILGLGYHPTDQQLLVLHVDGVLRGYCPGHGSEMSTALFACQVNDAMGKVLPAVGTLEALPHPTMPGGMLLMQSTRQGALNIMEQVGRGAPKTLLSTHIQGWVSVLGMGYHKDSQLILVFGMTDNGKVCPAAWKVLGRANTPGLKLVHWKIEPNDLGPLMDPLQQAKPSVVPPSAPSSSGPTQAASQVAVLNVWGLSDSSSPAKEKAKKVADERPPPWLSLWAPSAVWASESQSSALLERRMGPCVSRIVIHSQLGTVACRLEPSYMVQSMPALLDQTMGGLTDQELAMARRTASVPLMSLVLSEPHFFGWHGGHAAVMHTPLSVWKPDPTFGSRLQLPCHLYYASSDMVWKHSLATQRSSSLVSLPSEASAGNTRRVKHMILGPKTGAFLIFFEACGASDDAVDRWQWTLLLTSALQSSSPALWFKGGKYGAFLGSDDAHFAVVEPTGNVAAVFVTALTTSPSATPLYTINMDGGSIANGMVACPLFPGAPCKVMPVPEEPAEGDVPSEDEAEQDDDEHEEAARKGSKKGLGVLMWQTADGHLACTTMPFMRHTAPTGKADSAEEEEGPIGSGQHLGKMDRQAQLELLPGEHVLQVAWQSLTSITPVLPGDAIGAVLTCRRIIMVTADLHLHASIDIQHGNLSALSHPVTSLLWVGPALLYLTASGQVMQMCWNGTSQPFCHVAPSHNNFLVGATPNSLLLLRLTPTGAWEVITRPASLLQPLLIGWAHLAASGLSGGSASLQAVRNSLQSTLAKCDMTSTTPSLVWGLVSACAWDVAAAVANFSGSSSLDSSARMAANASAAQWWAVVQELGQESSRSLYHPSPPPCGSGLHAKLLAAGAGAASHGQISKAVELLKMAGEWRTAMVLSACQGDFSTVYAIVQQLGALGVSAAEVAEATAVSTALRGMYNSTSNPTPDYTLQLVDPDGFALTPASTWTLGSGGACMQAEAVAGSTPAFLIADGEVGPLPELFRPLPASFLGLDADTTAKVVGSMDTTTVKRIHHAARKGSENPMDTMSVASSGPSLFDLQGGNAANAARTGSEPQTAALADFMSFGDNGSFKSRGPSGVDSSDEDLDLDDFSNMGGNARKFKIQIKAKDAAASSVASADLRSAVSNIKLGAPPNMYMLPGSTSLNKANSGLPPLAPTTPAFDLDFFSAQPRPAAAPVLSPALQPVISVALQPGALMPPLAPAPQPGISPVLQAHLTPPQAPPPTYQPSPQAPPTYLPPPQAGQPAPPPGGPTSMQLYQQGVARMEAADWAKAAIAFECALEKLQQEAKGPGHEQRVSFCAHYFAAVRLLSVAAAGGAGPKEARLYRFLSALTLDDRHQLALTREAVQRNRAVGNILFCTDLLTTLITKLIGNAPEAYMAQLQQELAELDRAGSSSNKSIPGGENLEDFAAIVSASGSKRDVDLVVDPVLSAQW